MLCLQTITPIGSELDGSLGYAWGDGVRDLGCFAGRGGLTRKDR